MMNHVANNLSLYEFSHLFFVDHEIPQLHLTLLSQIVNQLNYNLILLVPVHLLPSIPLASDYTSVHGAYSLRQIPRQKPDSEVKIL